MRLSREELERVFRNVIDNYLRPILKEEVKRLESTILALNDRVESVERELRLDPRKGLREELERIEGRARMLLDQLPEKSA